MASHTLLPPPSTAGRGPSAMARVRARRNRRSSPTPAAALPLNIPCGGMFALEANVASGSLPASSLPPRRTPVASSTARTHCFSSTPALLFPSPVSRARSTLSWRSTCVFFKSFTIFCNLYNNTVFFIRILGHHPASSEHSNTTTRVVNTRLNRVKLILFEQSRGISF